MRIFIIFLLFFCCTVNNGFGYHHIKLDSVFSVVNEALSDSGVFVDLENEFTIDSLNRGLGKRILESTNIEESELFRVRSPFLNDDFLGFRFGNRALLIPLNRKTEGFYKGFFLFEKERECFLFFALNCPIQWNGSFKNRNLREIVCFENSKYPLSRMFFNKGVIQYAVFYQFDANEKYLNESIFLSLADKSGGDYSLTSVWSRLKVASQMGRLITLVSHCPTLTPIYKLDTSYSSGFGGTWKKE